MPRYTWVSIFALFVVGLGSTAARGESLDDLFKQAIEFQASNKNSDIEVQLATLERTQQRSDFLPELSLRSEMGAASGSFGTKTGHLTSFVLQQPLYRGSTRGKVWELSEQSIERAEAIQQSTRIRTYVALSESFFRTLSLKDEVRHIFVQKKAIRERLNIIESRVNIGQNKATDLIAAKAQLARLEAEAQRVDGQLQAAYRDLAGKVGKKTWPFQIDFKPHVAQEPIPKEWDFKNHPFVKVLETEIKQAKLSADVVEGSKWPDLDLEGRYYVGSDHLINRDWELGVVAQWLIFDYGVRDSKKETALLKAKIKENEFSELVFQLQRDFQNLNKLLKHAHDEEVKLRSAVALGEKNYKLHQTEYQRGLVSNLEVLRALDDLLVLKKAMTGKKYEKALYQSRLKALMGDIP